MRLLLVGGSGHVGSMTLPYLKTHHACRVLDLKPPGDDSVEFVQGSVTDPQAVRRAVEGMDTFIYMVMQHSDAAPSLNTGGVVSNYQVNLLGLHLVLQAAKDMGIRRGVYTSTMTVHERTRNWFPSEEEVPLDNGTVYGFTKGLGEQVCRYFCREHGLAILALRITGPSTRQQWLERRLQPKADPEHIWWTDEEDLAGAYLAAVASQHQGFEAVFIAGDEEHREINLTKAKRLLGWEPLARKQLKLPPS